MEADMQLKLVKTLLSKRPGHGSFIVGLVSFMVLVLVYQLNFMQILPPDLMSASSKQVFQDQEYWRAFTTTFIHADYNHLMMNSAFFSILALLLHTYYGSFIFPVVSVIIGGIINLIVLKTYPSHVTLVGISGVVYFMAAFWLTLYVFTERRLSILRRMINSTALSLIFFFPQVIEPQVSYSAHAVGFALGVPGAMTYFAAMRDCIRSHEVWEVVPEEVFFPEDDISQEENV
jgi:rhomboid protease GluP